MAKVSTSALLATADAARILNITPHTVRIARRRGDLKPAVVSTSGICLFTREEVDRYAASRAARRRLVEQIEER